MPKDDWAKHLLLGGAKSTFNMQKIFCDNCEKEITGNEMGKLVYTEIKTPLVVKGNENPGPQLVQINKDLCKNCLSKIKKSL